MHLFGSRGCSPERKPRQEGRRVKPSPRWLLIDRNDTVKRTRFFIGNGGKIRVPCSSGKIDLMGSTFQRGGLLMNRHRSVFPMRIVSFSVRLRAGQAGGGCAVFKGRQPFFERLLSQERVRFFDLPAGDDTLSIEADGDAPHAANGKVHPGEFIPPAPFRLIRKSEQSMEEIPSDLEDGLKGWWFSPLEKWVWRGSHG